MAPLFTLPFRIIYSRFFLWDGFFIFFVFVIWRLFGVWGSGFVRLCNKTVMQTNFPINVCGEGRRGEKKKRQRESIEANNLFFLLLTVVADPSLSKYNQLFKDCGVGQIVRQCRYATILHYSILDWLFSLSLSLSTILFHLIL